MKKDLVSPIKILILATFIGSSLFLPWISQADSYDIYVNESFDDDSNGSKDKPFTKIGDAIEKAKSKDKIYVSNGQYDESFTIPEKVGIYGENNDKVVISGTIRMKNGATLENITVSGGNKAVLVDENANIVISKSIIRDAARIGIDIPPGNGKVSIKNSKIYNNGKGLYIQSGNRFEISGSSVYKNREEGIDLRDNNDGFIQGNEIYENGESGIEIILGKTDMVISGNSIRDNKASGIAPQYYESFGDDGVLVVKNNSIKNNDAYGLRCNMPSGGKPSLDYWDKSMTLDDNVFGGNSKGQFSLLCRLTLNKEEIADITEKQDPETPQQTALAKQKELEESQGALEEAIRQTQERELELEASFNELEAGITAKLGDLEKKNWFGYLFKGPQKDKIAEIDNDLNISREKIGEMRSVAEQAPTDEIKGSIENEIISLEQSVANNEQILEISKNDLNFWNRLKDVFNY